MSVWDTVESVKDRASYPAFAKKFPAQARSFEHAIQSFTKLSKDDPKICRAVKSLNNNYTAAEEAVAALTKANTPNAAELKAAQEALTKAKTAFEDFFSGVAEVEGVKASKNFQAAYKQMGEFAEVASKIMGGLGGKVRVNGWGAALKDNLNVFDTKVTEGRKGSVFGRTAGVAVGVSMVGDAVLRSKSGDEKRSVFGRVLEGATGLALAGGSALAGAAR